MARKKKSSLPSHPDFPEKWAKYVPEHWVPDAEKMEREQMERCVTECEMTILATENEVADDAKIQQLKDDLKYLREGYKEVVNAQKSKIQFLLYLMNTRGYNVKIHDDKPTDEGDDGEE